MRRCGWRNRGLALLAALAALGLLRSLLVLQAPAAADLPEPLLRAVARLPGYRSTVLPTQPARRERDLAWGPRYRWRLLPAAGSEPLLLELVVRRSRQGEALPPEPLVAPRLLRLGPRQQVALGRSGSLPALRTCLVGRGPDEAGPTVAVRPYDLSQAVARWRRRLDGPASSGNWWRRQAAIQAGLRLEERWECLRVTLQFDGPIAAGTAAARDTAAADAQLLEAWRQLRPGLRSWGEAWEGLGY
ncbi:MAG: hypothetical protein R6W06_03015 [Prochlorococcaceae cyanobacterium]